MTYYYNKGNHGIDCAFHNSQDEFGECWGDVSLVDDLIYIENDDYDHLFFCEGHIEIPYAGDYRPYPEIKINLGSKHLAKKELKKRN